MPKKSLFAGFLAVLLAVAHPARAGSEPPFLALGAGAIGVIADRDKAGVFHFEYRSDLDLWKIRPFIGGFATTDASIYGYFGFALDVFFGRRVVLRPNVAVGVYEEGDGQDLGHTIEFRSGLELAYRFDDRSRLGVAVNHLSNASIGDSNPGTEEVVLFYSVPLRKLFGE